MLSLQRGRYLKKFFIVFVVKSLRILFKAKVSHTMIVNFPPR